jgi:WD40 repeat protein
VTQFSNRVGLLHTASADGSLRIWNWNNGELVHAMENIHQHVVRGCVWTGEFMISGGLDGVLRVSNIEGGHLHSERRSEHARVYKMISGHGILAVATRSGMDRSLLELWDLEDLSYGQL